MNFKKSVSVFLGFVMFISSPNSVRANYNAEPVQGVVNDQNITFVPDEDIIIDSENISKVLGADEVKRLNFVPPDGNSDNLLSKELFPNDSPKPQDVQQGGLGVCYFLAVLSTLANKEPDLLKKNLVDDGNGNVIVKFFDPYTVKPFYVKVQKTVPKLTNDLKFVRNDCLWVHMYLKAFVASGYGGMVGWKNHGIALKSYKLSEGCYPDLPMRMLTGKDTKIEGFFPGYNSSNAESLYNKIENTLLSGGIAVCDFVPKIDKTKLPKDSVFYKGILREHAYSVEELYEYSNGPKWVKLRNPWGYHVPRYGNGGKIIVDDSPQSNGYFILKFEDYVSQPVWTYLSKNGKNEKIKNNSTVKIPFWFYLFMCGCYAAMITIPLVWLK